MKRFVKIIGAVLISAALVGCASTGSVDKGEKPAKEKSDKPAKAKKSKGKFNEAEFNEAFEAKDYELCVSMLEKAGKSDLKYALDFALLQHMTGDFASSTSSLNKASQMIYDAFEKSVTREVGATALNDNIAEYSGNDYEVLFVNAFNALNYINQDNLEDALAEIRRLDEWYNANDARNILDQDDESNEELNEAMEKVGLKMSMFKIPAKSTDADIYRDSKFVRYLSTVLYAMDGDTNADVDARALAKMDNAFENIYEEETNIPSGQGRLDVVSLAGQILQRKADIGTVSAPLLSAFCPSLMSVGISPDSFHIAYGFPNYPEKNVNSVSVKSVTIGDQKLDMKLVENFDEAVKKDVARKARKACNRSITRSTIAKVAALASGEVAVKNAKEKAEKNPIFEAGIMAAAKAGEAALRAADLMATPDTRQCAFLPAAAYAGGINLEPGTYTVTVEYSNGTSDVIENVEITAGKTKLIESVCLK